MNLSSLHDIRHCWHSNAGRLHGCELHRALLGRAFCMLLGRQRQGEPCTCSLRQHALQSRNISLGNSVNYTATWLRMSHIALQSQNAMSVQQKSAAADQKSDSCKGPSRNAYLQRVSTPGSNRIGRCIYDEAKVDTHM